MTTVLYPQLWPHSFLSLMNARRDINVRGVRCWLRTNPPIPRHCGDSARRSAQLKHLVSLMYFAQQYEWQAYSVFMGLFFWKSSTAS